MNLITEKLCSKCCIVKPIVEFFRVSKGRTERRSWCRTCRNISRRAAYHRNPQPSRDKVKQSGYELRREVLEAYGGKCACPGCGIDLPVFLSLDHVNGDGKAHRRATGDGWRSVYLWAKRNGFPKDRFQLLCYNCNFAKRTGIRCPRYNLSHVLGEPL